MQSQLELFVEAINTYYADRLERNNVILELNCAFQKTDVFEPFALEYRLKDSDTGEVERLKAPFILDHQEGDMISLIFVDARNGQNNAQIVPEEYIQYVKQYTIGIFLAEDASDNSIDGVLPGLVGLRARRQSANDIYFRRLGRNDELQTLYQLGGQGVGSTNLGMHNAMPRQVIIGRMGLLYYIGPLLTEAELLQQIENHI